MTTRKTFQITKEKIGPDGEIMEVGYYFWIPSFDFDMAYQGPFKTLEEALVYEI